MANPVDLFRKPDHVPGEKMSEVVGRTPLWAKAERVVDSDWTGDGTVQLFKVPAKTLVMELIIRVRGAFVGVTTLTLGDGVDPDRFMDNTLLAPGTAGYKTTKGDTQPGSGAHYYSAADTIDLAQAGTPSAGTLDAWVCYLLNADEYGLEST